MSRLSAGEKWETKEVISERMSVKEKYKKLSVEIILFLFANLHIQKDDESCKLPFNQHCIRLLNVRSEIFIFGSLSSASRVGCTSLTACYSFFNVLTNLAVYVPACTYEGDNIVLLLQVC